MEKLKRFQEIRYVFGQHRVSDIQTADLIIRNPGVPDNSPWLRKAYKHGVPVSSDIEIFFQNCPTPIIGITGTKGKSTAVYLLGKMLRTGKKRVFIGGNIRTSVLEILPKIRKGDAVILELSSFQLDMLRPHHISPHIAGITNIFPDHLNRYASFSAYVRSKMGIFRFQKKSDRLFINADDPVLRQIVKQAPGKVSLIHTARTVLPWTDILAKHYAAYQFPSVALAVAIAQSFGVSALAIGRVLAHTKLLSGRLETVRCVHGITFINDTTATNPDAAIAALREIRKRFRGVVLIAGGADKKLDFRVFVRAIQKYAHAVILLPGTATNALATALADAGKKVRIRRSVSMRKAILMARQEARVGDAVLLSPGAASFGLFQNEFDRGDQFVRAVQDL